MKSQFKHFVFLCVLFCLSVLVSCEIFDPSPDGEQSNDITYSYKTYSDGTKYLKDVVRSYPSITSMTSIGKSVLGKDINAIILSSHPEKIGILPSLRFTGSIHGNEKIGGELLFRFIDYMTKNYGKSANIKNIVDNYCIAIIPILNPDGYEANTRENANGIDLNRDFINYDEYDSTFYLVSKLFSQPESKAVRDYNADKFDLSLSFHSGNMVVNYPFDFSRRIYPYHIEKIIDLASMYANT